MSDHHRPVPSYEGWKEIAAALGVSVPTAMDYAARSYLPLVVYVDHANRVWCPHANVSSFVNQMHLPLWAHRTLRAVGRLPHQLDAKGKPLKGPRRGLRRRHRC
jgi:hypothetical protein